MLDRLVPGDGQGHHRVYGRRLRRRRDPLHDQRLGSHHDEPAVRRALQRLADDDGKYRAWDNLGNIESTKSQTIRLDSLAPTVAITSPTAGSTVTGNVKIDASATDGGSGVASVKFYVDGQLDATVTALPYRDNWNSKKFSKGQHTLTAVAVDAAGNAATSTAVTVTVN